MKAIFIFLFLFSCNSYKPSPEKSNSQLPKIPNLVEFAGERVPLEDRDVYERLEKELIVNQNYHSSTILIFKNMARYKKQIISVLRENNVPEDFFYLAVAESALNPNATSSANAVGVWQFLQATAEGYGLEVNQYVDERRNTYKATKAACKYLTEAFKEFGTWSLAAASYNRGLKGMKDAVSNQKINDYYKLYLNQETYRYIFRIIALKLILSNPTEYGFNLDESIQYEDYKFETVLVKENISDLPDFALKNKSNYKELILHNPWIRTGKYNFEISNGKTYEFLFPRN